jgi:protein involved in polysaccharide export with SLBB domain
MVSSSSHRTLRRRTAALPFPAAMGPRRWRLAQALFLGLIWFSTQVLAQPMAAAMVAQAPSNEYRISRGDDLDLKFFYTPELNTRALVRSDGRISVPLLGELLVEGRTVAELGSLIEQRLAGQVNRPQVAINVQASSAMRVFVGGEVGKAGMQPLAGPLTALQAVMVAEGVKDTAQPSLALVLRRAPDGGRQVIPFDLDAAMKGQSPHAELVLQPFDAVIVPRSGIADVGRWVDLYIRRTLPFNFGLSYNVNGRTVSP